MFFSKTDPEPPPIPSKIELTPIQVIHRALEQVKRDLNQESMTIISDFELKILEGPSLTYDPWFIQDESRIQVRFTVKEIHGDSRSTQETTTT